MEAWNDLVTLAKHIWKLVVEYRTPIVFWLGIFFVVRTYDYTNKNLEGNGAAIRSILIGIFCILLGIFFKLAP